MVVSWVYTDLNLYFIQHTSKHQEANNLRKKFLGGLSRGGELCPECEFAALKLPVKATGYGIMKERASCQR